MVRVETESGLRFPYINQILCNIKMCLIIGNTKYNVGQSYRDYDNWIYDNKLPESGISLKMKSAAS